MARDRIEAQLTEFQKQGEISREEIKRFADEAMAKGREEQDGFEERIRECMRKAHVRAQPGHQGRHPGAERPSQKILMLTNFSPARVYKTLRILLTVFALALHKKRALLVRPLPRKAQTLHPGPGRLLHQVRPGPGHKGRLFRGRIPRPPAHHPRRSPAHGRTRLPHHVPTRVRQELPLCQLRGKAHCQRLHRQVHKAVLRDGTVVAVKLRRLNIRRKVRADLLVLRAFLFLFKPLFSRYTKNSWKRSSPNFRT